MTDVGQLERLLQLRVVVARVGEMDRAKWWNTTGQLGPLGAAAVGRGLPRTHYFAQARSVFAVAAHRCDEVFNAPNSVTLWRLSHEIEEQFDARWEHWLDNAREWDPFFERVGGIETTDVGVALREFGLVDDGQIKATARLEPGEGARSIGMEEPFSASDEDVARLAAGFGLGRSGTLVVPYAHLGHQ